MTDLVVLRSRVGILCAPGVHRAGSRQKDWKVEKMNMAPVPERESGPFRQENHA